jgi:hypothetical protein
MLQAPEWSRPHIGHGCRWLLLRQVPDALL